MEPEDEVIDADRDILTDPLGYDIRCPDDVRRLLAQVAHVGRPAPPPLICELQLQLLTGISHRDHQARGLPDLAVVSADPPALGFEFGELLLEEARRLGPGEVDGVRVLRGDPQGQAACAAYPDRYPGLLDGFRGADRVLDRVVSTLIGGLLPRPHQLRYLQRLVQLTNPYGGWRVPVAVCSIFDILPAGADAEVDPAAAYVVEARGDLRHQRRVPVALGGDHGAQPEPPRVPRDGGEGRPALEAGCLHRLVGHEEVV